MSAPPLSESFARWVTDLRYVDLPAEVLAAAKESIRDVVGVALLGADQPWGDAYRVVYPDTGSNTGCTLIGRAATAPRTAAAFLNAITAHCCELDDFIQGAGGHPGVVVVPLALALAEDRGLSGRDVLVAVVAGYEIMYRATAPIHPQHLTRGFQGTGLGGPFGAAAAAASLLGMSWQQTAQALSIAGSYACGLCEYDQSGGEVKRLYAGLAARAGLESAELARSGLTGPPTIFEGKRGVYKGFANEADESKALEGLGHDHRILRRWVKPYPAVASIHSVIDAARTLCAEETFDPADIVEIEVAVARTTLLHGGAVGQPHDMVSAQFSLSFSLALALLFGRNDLELYSDETLWSRPDVVELVKATTVVADEDAAGPLKNRATVRVVLRDGRALVRGQDHPTGSPANPLGADQLRARFAAHAGEHDPVRVAALDRAIEELDSTPDVSALMRLLSAPRMTTVLTGTTGNRGRNRKE